MAIKIEVRLKAGIKFDENAGIHITYAPALSIYSQGETVIGAKAALEDAVYSFFTVALKKTVLEKCLQDLGFSLVSPADVMPCDGQAEYIDIRETKILEEKMFSDIYELRPASMALAMAQTV